MKSFLKTNEDVRTAIRRRCREIMKNMTPKEFFLSSDFYNYARNLSSFILRRRPLHSLKFTCKKDEYVAYTDGDNIFVNIENRLVRHSDQLEQKFHTVMGILFHECAHKLFTDFKVLRQFRLSVADGVLPGEFHCNGDPKLESNLDELRTLMSGAYKAQISQIMFHIYSDITNIIDDGHDEASMKKRFPGFVASCIETAGYVQTQLGTSIENAIEKKAKPLDIIFQLCLYHAKGFDYDLGHLTPEVQKYLNFMKTIEPIIDDAVSSDDYDTRWSYCNDLVLYCWPVIKDYIIEASKSYSSSGACGGDQSDDDNGAGGSPSGASGGDQSGDNSGAGGSPSGASGSDQSDDDNGAGGSPSGASGGDQSDDDADAGTSTSGSSNGDQSDDDNGAGGSPSGASGGDQSDDDADAGTSTSGSSNGDQSDDDADAGSSLSDIENALDTLKTKSEQNVERVLDNLSEEERNDLVSQIIEAIQEAIESSNSANAPVNCNSSPITDTDTFSGNDAGSMTDFSSLCSQMANDAAESEIQQELDQAQMDAIRNLDMPLIHQNRPVFITRHNAENEYQYRMILNEVLPITRNLVRQVKDLFREMDSSYTMHRLRFGPKIEANQAYRRDKTFFAKKKLPIDRPDLAVCFLVDQSGSMSGRKIKSAQKTTIMLQRFAAELQIPCMIAGHNTSSRGCELYIYSDYASATVKNDCFSLGGMNARGSNRDGLAIKICGELLAKRPEQVKLMVIISDGAPADYGYTGPQAADDIRKIVRELHRKDLLIYGAAIDDDREVIESLYGNTFLSIQNLDAMPKTMIRLLRKHLRL